MTLPNPFLKVEIRCAVPGCNQIKKQTNHWFVVRRVMQSYPDKNLIFSVFRFDDGLLRKYPESLPVCGQACLQKLTSHFLSQ